MRKSFLVFNLLTGLALTVPAQYPTEDPIQDIDRIRALVEAGAAPRAALERAQNALLEREDDAILRRTLYGTVKFEDVTERDLEQMIGAAQRRVARVEGRLAELRPLVEQGIAARVTLEPLVADLEERNRTLKLAQDRAEFIERLAEMARVEQAAQSDPPEPTAVKPLWQRFDGRATFSPTHMKTIFSAYEQKFSRRLPVSAYGTTSYHRALGFDHTGRMDVQLSPDSDEGAWLLQLLQSLDVPFFAFRTAVSGSASGAHIHVGPPSIRRTAIAD